MKQRVRHSIGNYEELLIFTGGLMLAGDVILRIFFAPRMPLPFWVIQIGLLVWVIMFIQWAIKGGIPPRVG